MMLPDVLEALWIITERYGSDTQLQTERYRTIMENIDFAHH